MNGRVSARALMIVVVVLAAMGCTSASADPLQCQARAGNWSSPLPVDVSFQALVAGGHPPYSFFWDFRDGSTSTEQNPTHTYTNNNFEWSVLLTVTGAPGSGEVCMDTVFVAPGVVVDYSCLISAQPRWSEDSNAIQFTAMPGFVFEDPPYTWTWSLGDGTTGAQQSPDGRPCQVLHAYAAPGTYWVVASLRTTHFEYVCGTTRVTTLVPQVVAAGETPVSGGLRLDPPRPSPFVAATTLAFVLPHAGRVRLAIVDAGGRRITTLVDEVRSAGPHVAVWQGRAAAGYLVPAGVYFAVLEHGGMTQTARIARLR
jgi:hypothetical protein